MVPYWISIISVPFPNLPMVGFGPLTPSKVSLEKEKADVDAQIEDVKEYKGQKGEDLGSENKLSKALYEDCSWVATHFETRRTKRKTEMDGLNEAKDYLAGVPEVTAR